MANRETRLDTGEHRDPRWKLVDSILRRLGFLIAHLGISTREVIARLERVSRGLEAELQRKTTFKGGRRYDEVHGGPAIMHAWFRELDYVDALGQALPLRVQGPGLSFAGLVRASAPGIDPDSVLTELVAAEAVRVVAPGIVEPMNGVVIVHGAEPRAELGLYAVDNLLAAICMNVHADPNSATFQREASCLRFERRQLSRVRDHLSEQCSAGVNQADEWMNQYALGKDARPEDATTVVVGTYIALRNVAESGSRKRR